MNLDRLIQMVLRIVIARGVGLVMNRAFGWFDRRNRAATARQAGPDGVAAPDAPRPKDAAPVPGPDAKRLRQQMRMISRIGRMR
jgi:hypothetical protein